MKYRLGSYLTLIVLISLSIPLHALGQEAFSPSRLILDVFVDGVVDVEYALDVDITTKFLTTPLAA